MNEEESYAALLGKWKYRDKLMSVDVVRLF